MLITKKKHESIIAMKDCDIKILNNKLEGVKELLKARDLELYEVNQEANKLSEEIEFLKVRERDKDISIDYLEEANNSLLKDIDRINEVNIDLNHRLLEVRNENEELKKRLDKIDSLKKQYKEYIDIAIDASVVSHTLTKEDIKKFLSNKGIEGIVKLYAIVSMM